MSDKKRSNYQKKGKLDLPEHLIDRSKYGYRWVRASAFDETSYDYEPRGWEKAHTEDGKIIKNGDLVLGRMPIDSYKAMKEAKDEERKNQLMQTLQNQAAEEDRASHEFKKKGGKVKFEFTQE